MLFSYAIVPSSGYNTKLRRGWKYLGPVKVSVTFFKKRKKKTPPKITLSIQPSAFLKAAVPLCGLKYAVSCKQDKRMWKSQ